ncbi:hypothetical protein CNMCM5623_003553 [Aspergillus felis]|uniref:Uncharacterized protein n=1 Tax=Aspergillus felis TaxID=1287682 RepID=A0A8H6QFP3_9EURO|nr:hypothetical protein CNMCM5623_003553 [Aspergillus felis]
MNMATTTMSSTSTSTSTSTTSGASATCTGNRWVLPVQDVACALPATGNYSSVMDKCCSPAAVTKYNDGCDLYCLAQGHSMGELLNSECYRDGEFEFHGVEYGDEDGGERESDES